jgi:hypothetical protein
MCGFDSDTPLTGHAIGAFGDHVSQLCCDGGIPRPRKLSDASATMKGVRLEGPVRPTGDDVGQDLAARDAAGGHEDASDEGVTTLAKARAWLVARIVPSIARRARAKVIPNSPRRSTAATASSSTSGGYAKPTLVPTPMIRSIRPECEPR